jgi:hypothetical protein
MDESCDKMGHNQNKFDIRSKKITLQNRNEWGTRLREGLKNPTKK